MAPLPGHAGLRQGGTDASDRQAAERCRLAERFEDVDFVRVQPRAVAMQSVKCKPAQIVAFKDGNCDCRHNPRLRHFDLYSFAQVAQLQATPLRREETHDVVLAFERGPAAGGVDGERGLVGTVAVRL